MYTGVQAPDQWDRSRRQRTIDNAWSGPIGELRSTMAAAHPQAFVMTEECWCKDVTFFSLFWSSYSSLSLDVTNIFVWVTALWVMKTKIARYQMKAVTAAVWCELLHPDKNRKVLTLHILIDQISYKLWLWITKMRSLDIVFCVFTLTLQSDYTFLEPDTNLFLMLNAPGFILFLGVDVLWGVLGFGTAGAFDLDFLPSISRKINHLFCRSFNFFHLSVHFCVRSSSS